MKFTRAVVTLATSAALVFVVESCFARNNSSDKDAIERSDVKIPRSTSYKIKSKRNGVIYNLTIFVPSDYGSIKKRLPVIYVLDGDWLAPLIRSVAHISTDQSIIVVGIDSDQEDHHWQDLPTAGNDRHWVVRPDRGAENFLKILLEEIKPYIDQTYRTSSDTAIAGHSMGGFFALYAGLHAPEVFRRVIAFSPSLIWQDNILLKQQSEIARTRSDMPVRFYVDFGALEPRSDRAAALAAAVQAQGYPSLRWTNRVIPNQTHSSLPYSDASEALFAVYGPELRHLEPAELAEASGQYILSDGSSIRLFPRDGQLMMDWSSYDHEPIALLSAEPRKFFIRELGTRIELGQPAAAGPDIVVLKEATPGPGGEISTPRIEGKKLFPGPK